MIIWGAWLYLMVGEDPKKASDAKMTILYAVIGIVIALSAKGFPLVVASVFPNASVRACGASPVESVNSAINFPTAP